jgi:hypothetical protein
MNAHEIFSPVPWFTRGHWLEVAKFRSEKAKKEWRLTALCFAAAMRDTGDL